MAIFVAFAWMIEAAEYLGLIETEAQDPQSRAYRLAHQGLALFKDELVGARLEVLGEGALRKALPQGGEAVIESTGGLVRRRKEGVCEVLLDLGPGGGVDFRAHRPAGVELHIHARTKDGGAYDLTLILPPADPGGAAHRVSETGPGRGV